jgi:hypothetical protein
MPVATRGALNMSTDLLARDLILKPHLESLICLLEGLSTTSQVWFH